MPGKYLEFIRSGRYTVPVEISFLQTTISENGRDVVTSKWATHEHWKEIKNLLKPAVDSCTSSNPDGFSTTPHISYGQEVGLGYLLCVDSMKEKSSFFSVLDLKRNNWTDDEDDDLFTGLRDCGGSHRAYQPTKVYIKAAVIKRSNVNSNDTRKLKKELGFKGEDLRSYFGNTITPTSTLGSSMHEKDWIDSRNKRFGFGTLTGGAEMNDLNSFPPFSRRLGLVMERPSAPFSRIKATYYEEQDDDETSAEGFLEVDPPHTEKNVRSEDDDTFSLPDIDAPQGDTQLKQQKKEVAKQNKKHKKGILEPESITSDFRSENGSNNFRKGSEDRVEKNNLDCATPPSPSKGIRLIKPNEDEFGMKIGTNTPSKASSRTRTNASAKTPLIVPNPLAHRRNPVAAKDVNAEEKAPGSKEVKDTQPRPRRIIECVITDEYLQSVTEGMRLAAAHVVNQSLRTTTNILNKKTELRQHKIETKSPELPATRSDTLTLRQDLRKRGLSAEVDERSTRLIAEEPSIQNLPTDQMEDGIKRRKTQTVTLSETPAHQSGPSTAAPEIRTKPNDRKPPKTRRTDVKKELSQPLPNQTPFELLIQDSMLSIDLMDLEFDPDMPILSPVFADEIFRETKFDNLPVLKAELPKRNGKTKEGLKRKKKLTDKILGVDQAEKSTSTEDSDSGVFPNPSTGEFILSDLPLDDDADEIQHRLDILSEQFAAELPVDLGADIPADDHDNPGGTAGSNLLTPQPIEFVQSSVMMPPPARPAPRTPRKIPVGGQFPTFPQNESNLPTKSIDFTDPSKLSTIQLMSNPSTISAGVGLLKTLGSKKKTGGNGFDSRRDRAVSPDITAVTRHATKVQNVSMRIQEFNSAHLNSDKGHCDEDFSFSDNDPDHHEGESLIRELLYRVNENTMNQDAYEPEGDGYDLSQRSMCYLNIIPEYSKKSRSFKIHCKQIVDLSFEKLVEHYHRIRPALRQIFEGEVPNVRSATYLQGPAGLKRLQEMNVSTPFESDQTSTIIRYLLEYFIPDPEQRARHSDYVSYVLLPEALINIYARVNEISYEMAEKEMRFQGCYDDASF